MKALLTLTLFCLSSIALASPVCYEPEDNWSELPQEICFEKIEANLDTSVLSIVESGKVFPEALPLNYLARRNENGFSFRASHLYLDSWEGGCESGATVVLNLKGKTDNDGLVEYLEVSADYEYAHDSCHSEVSKGHAKYKLKK